MIRNAAKPSAPSPESKVPTFYRGSDLSRYLTDTMGEDTLTAIGKAKDNKERQRVLVEALRKAHPEMNGEAEKEARKLLLNKQELERKEGWFTKLWKAPFRAMGWVGKKTFVEHPVLSTAVVLALLYWFSPALLSGLAGIEGVEAKNALSRAGEILKSFLRFSVGKTGKIPDIALGPLPGSP